MLLWLVDAARRNRSLYIGWLAVWTSFIQLYGYGLGFLYGTWQRRIRRREEAYTYRVTKFFSQKTGSRPRAPYMPKAAPIGTAFAVSVRTGRIIS